MIYAYDLALQMPTKDLYDTQMMLASILAAKDLYNDRLKQLEDFNKLYDDFYSPIAEDNADYDKLTSGRVRDALNYMYQNGIDPLRSAEGGALLSRIINTTPTREINAIKQNAAIKTAYDKAVADAKKAGTYNEEFEQQLLKNANLLNFRTINPDGSINTWGRNAPGVFKTLHDFAEPEYNKFDATEYIGQSRPGYNLYGVSKANQDLASEAALNQLKTDPELYSYYANKVQDYKTEEESTDDALRRMINQDAQHWLQPKEEIDPYYKMLKEHNYDISKMQKQQQLEYEYKVKEWTDPNNPNSLEGRLRLEQEKQKRQNEKSISGHRKNTGEYSHFLMLSDAAAGEVNEKMKSASTNKVVGKITTNGLNKDVVAERVQFTDNNGNQYSQMMVQDPEGEYKIGDKSYRLLTPEEKQTYIIQSNIDIDNSRQAWNDLKIKDRYETLGDYLGFDKDNDATYEVANEDGAETTKMYYYGDRKGISPVYDPALLDDIYTIDGVMKNTYGNNKTKTMHLSKELTDQFDNTTKIEYTGYAGEPIMNDGKKWKLLEVTIKHKGKTYKTLAKVGEYERDETGMWVPTDKWASRMIPGDRSVSSNTVGNTGAVNIYNIGGDE